jgi:hypothetical protein
MKITWIIPVSLLLVSAFVSCKKTALETPNAPAVQELPTTFHVDATLENGMLHFPTNEAFHQALSAVNTFAPARVSAWENEIGFTSAQSLYDQAQQAMEVQPALTVEADYMAKYPGLFKKTEESGMELNLTNTSVTHLINAERLLMITGHLYKFTENGQFIIFNNRRDLLMEAEASKVCVEGSYMFFPAEGPSLARSCGYALPEQIYYNSNNTRQSKLTHVMTRSITYENATGKYAVSIIADVKGLAKKKVLGSWVNYSTSQELEWDFEVDIVNEYSLETYPNGLPTGAEIVKLNKFHSGTRSENGQYTAYWTEYFYAIHVPYALLNYSQEVWERVTDNRHRTGGITPNWNIYSCQ